MIHVHVHVHAIQLHVWRQLQVHLQPCHYNRNHTVTLSLSGCWFGDDEFYQLQQSWHPVLQPTGLMVCVICTCHPVSTTWRHSVPAIQWVTCDVTLYLQSSEHHVPSVCTISTCASWCPLMSSQFHYVCCHFASNAWRHGVLLNWLGVNRLLRIHVIS